MADESKRIIKVDYKAYLADRNTLYDTTNADAAKEAGLFNENYTYSPFPYIEGSSKVFDGLGEAFLAAEIGKETEVTIPCEKAAGKSDTKQIQFVPMNVFQKKNVYPQVGMTVNIENRTGTIVSVGAGRVKVDFNSPLAGHDLLYKFTVVEEVKEPVDKVKAIVEAYYNRTDNMEYEICEDKVVIKENDFCKYDSAWTQSKFKIVADIRSVLGINRIDFIQTWDIPKKE
ncbi:MAG: peptidylprolyl isomerase [Candidatus Methanomethylophilaceae archaeon]|nr:peptidylprolyl isomerase [Candidatus Methanomethylophilaceae archaeon]